MFTVIAVAVIVIEKWRKRFEGQMKTDSLADPCVWPTIVGLCWFWMRRAEGSHIIWEYCYTATCSAVSLLKSFWNEFWLFSLLRMKDIQNQHRNSKNCTCTVFATLQ